MLRRLSLVFLIIFGVLCVSYADAITRQEYAHKLISQARQMSKQKGKEFLALSYANEAVKAYRQDLNIRYERAFILGRTGLYEDAIREFSMFMKLKGFPHAVRFRADCYMALGDMQRAAIDYKAFLKSESRDGKVWSYLVEALVLSGQREAALAAANKGIATGSHWTGRLQNLQKKILLGEKIVAHKPLSN